MLLAFHFIALEIIAAISDRFTVCIGRSMPSEYPSTTPSATAVRIPCSAHSGMLSLSLKDIALAS